ncbi:hypothetical protein [Gillisia hiemivivida]|uniref:Uncharacterized protein n=1 Tax=Gillisia hiemivivida TaxID=291190 RepID=A0A5C6ZQI0_9FLAO|nr:hypothetical protein [Gillisia hiemivivida]TXD93099.1 hypothetical protein ES724_11765 [Gillisia hiemivivida]
MRNTYLIFTLLIGFCFTSVGQNLNSYKYVSVPEKFDFLKESNEYQMNELTKFLFEKYGFTAILENEEVPSDFSKQDCNILYADLIDNSGLFKTSLQISLKDCKNKQIFLSEEGSSREKEYKKAYQEALRDAFSSFETVNYSYDQNSVTGESVVASKQEEKENEKPVQENTKPKPEVILTAIPQVSKEASTIEKSASANKNEKVYVSGNVEFYILNTDFGYQLFQSQMEEPFAKLVKTGSENHFIYSTIQGQGIAYFDKDGNLNVEILNALDNSTSIKTYNIKN